MRAQLDSIFITPSIWFTHCTALMDLQLDAGKHKRLVHALKSMSEIFVHDSSQRVTSTPASDS